MSNRLSDMPLHGSNPGNLGAHVYVPSSVLRDAPLVVVLHGCLQTAGAYDQGSGWSQLSDRYGFVLLFPEQRRANNMANCFNWFASGDMNRGGGEALSISQMVEQVVAEYTIDRARIFATGLSAGGAMTSVMLATYPDVFAGGAIIAGLPYGRAMSAFQAMDRMQGLGGPKEIELQALVRGASRHQGRWPSVSIWHGSVDRTIDVSNVEAIIGQWRVLHGHGRVPTRTETVAGYPRRVWCDAAGRECIEDYAITDMGHGTPIDPGGSGGYGAADSFMLDAHISSTMHIARFWGILSEVDGEGSPSADSRRSDMPRRA